MRPFQVLLLSLACMAAGGAAGYKLALLRQQARLEKNKRLVRLSHQIWSKDHKASEALARQIYSDDYTVHDWSGDHRFTVGGVVDDAAQNRAIFPDWNEQVQSMVAEGDLVADRFLSTGTQAQDIPAVPHLMPVIPNKKRATQMPEIEVMRISNGKLAEQWDISDGWNANAQLGLFDPDNWPDSVCKSGDSLRGLH